MKIRKSDIELLVASFVVVALIMIGVATIQLSQQVNDLKTTNKNQAHALGVFQKSVVRNNEWLFDLGCRQTKQHQLYCTTSP